VKPFFLKEKKLTIFLDLDGTILSMKDTREHPSSKPIKFESNDGK